jgi:Cu(I)/Ag(I) efflux system membrane fusion protein
MYSISLRGRYWLAALVAISLAACSGGGGQNGSNNGGHKHGASTHTHDKDDKPVKTVSEAKYEAPAAFRKQLSSVAQHYLKVKDAFVASDNDLAQQAADSLIRALNPTAYPQQRSEAAKAWHQQKKRMLEAAKSIQNTAGLAKQRQSFEELSIVMNKAVEQFGVQDMALYVQHCPMAFNNKGADWLSTEKQISNPYFGDEMLRCGTNKRRLAFQGEAPAGQSVQ